MIGTPCWEGNPFLSHLLDEPPNYLYTFYYDEMYCDHTG